MANGEQEKGHGFLRFLLGSALAGFGGDTGFSTRWIEQQQMEEQRRKEEERQQRRDTIMAGQALSPVLQGMGLEGLNRQRPSESIPLRETEAGTLESDPTVKPKFTTGDEGIDTLLSLYSPGMEKEAHAVGRTLAQSALELDEKNFQKDLDRQIQIIEATEPVKQKFALEAAIEQFNALEPARYEADKKRALLQHNLALQRQMAAQVPNAPTPASEFEAVAIGEAQRMLDSPEIMSMTVQQYRSALLQNSMQRYLVLGGKMPSEGEIMNAINDAGRFYNPKLKSITRSEEAAMSPEEAAARLANTPGVPK